MDLEYSFNERSRSILIGCEEGVSGNNMSEKQINKSQAQ